MNEKLVERYYELNQKLKQLQEERDLLNQEIKKFLIQSNIKKAQVGRYLVELKVQDRSRYEHGVTEYLKAVGLNELVIETYNEKQLKKQLKEGKLDSTELERCRIKNIVHILSVEVVK